MGSLGTLLDPLGTLLDPLWCILRVSWASLGTLWGCFGAQSGPEDSPGVSRVDCRSIVYVLGVCVDDMFAKF